MRYEGQWPAVDTTGLQVDTFRELRSSNLTHAAVPRDTGICPISPRPVLTSRPRPLPHRDDQTSP